MKKNYIKMIFVAAVLSMQSVTTARAEAVTDTEQTKGTSSYEMTVNKSAEGILPRGVSFNGESLEGLTLAQAKQKVNDYAAQYEARKVTLYVNGNSYEYTATDFGVSCSNPEAIDNLGDMVLSGNVIEQYKKQKDIEASPVDISIEFSFEQSRVTDVVEELAAENRVAAKNATAKKVGDSFEVTAGTTGIDYDTAGISESLSSLIGDFSNSSDIIYEFPSTETQPAYDESYFNFSASPLGSYTTTNLGSGNRKSNIERSAEKMNGHVFYPGDTISTLNMFSPVTVEEGYGTAPGYDRGQQKDTVGGGICQTTTTLYNAVIRAELTIGYRRGHSMLVTYVPPAMDATVDPASGSDFTFINSTKYPIYIESYVSGDSVTVNIWGVDERPANRTISFSTDDLTIVKWPEPLYNQVADDTQCTYGAANVAKKVKTVIDPHPEVIATSYKRVYIDGVETSCTVLNEKDHYGAMSGQLYHASDCTVDASIKSRTDGSGVYPYLSKDIYLEVRTLAGGTWPAY